MITITNEDFIKVHGIDLGLELSNLDDNEELKIVRIIALWTNRVYDEIRKSTRKVPSDDQLSAFQKESIKRAICDYGIYYLKNGDLYNQSGYDQDKGITGSKAQLNKIKMPSHVLDTLRQCGLLRTQW